MVMSSDPRIPGDHVITLDNADARLNVLSLLQLTPFVDVQSGLNGGTVDSVVLLRGKENLRLEGDEIRLEGIPVLESLGLKGEGKISLYLEVTDGIGDLKISVADMNLKGPSSSKFTIQGEGVHARIKGKVIQNDLDLHMELMVSSSFEMSNVLRMMLAQYMVSPGYYVVPIRTRLT
jgi:hypothetical protein